MDAWHVTPVFDAFIGDMDLFAGYSLDWTELRLSFAIGATTYANARGTLAAWRQEFMRDVSRNAMGTLVVVHDGGTYLQPVAHATPRITGPDGPYVGAELIWRTESPFWKYNDTQSTVSAFAGTVAVNVAWSNTGDYKTWPIHKITGACGTPKLTDVGSGDYLQIGTAWTNAADQVWIWTDEPLIRLYVNGASAGDRESGTNLTCYGGTVSVFKSLQVGAGTVQLTATSGTATYQLDYDIRKAGLG